jgi:hypothetical protein
VEVLVSPTQGLLTMTMKTVRPKARRLADLSLLAVALGLGVSACRLRPEREPDAQLIHFTAARGDTIIVNNEKPVPLPLPDPRASEWARRGGIAFEPIASRELELTAEGTVTCRHYGNANIRARIDGTLRTYQLLCRPVRVFYTHGGPVQFVTGDPVSGFPLDSVQGISIYARGPDNEPVTRLSGTLFIPNANIARGDGLRLTPRGVGSTLTSVTVGDHNAGQGVYVFERVSSVKALRPDQSMIALPVTLRAGETQRVTIPPGTWKFIMAPAGDSTGGIQYRVEGAACSRDKLPIRRSAYCFSRDSIDVRFTRPRGDSSSRPLVGELRLQRRAG